MERILDISKVEVGDFLSYQGLLGVVLSIKYDESVCTIKLDNGQTIVEKPDSRLEFFRTLDRLDL